MDPPRLFDSIVSFFWGQKRNGPLRGIIATGLFLL